MPTIPYFLIISTKDVLVPGEGVYPLFATKAELEKLHKPSTKLIDGDTALLDNIYRDEIYIFKGGALRITIDDEFSFEFLDEIPEHNAEELESFFTKYANWKQPSVLWQVSEECNSVYNYIFATQKSSTFLQSLTAEEIDSVVLETESTEGHYLLSLSFKPEVILITPDDKGFRIDQDTGLFAEVSLSDYTYDRKILETFRFFGPMSEFAKKVSSKALRFQEQNRIASAEVCLNHGAAELIKEYGTDKRHLADIALSELAARWIFQNHDDEQ